MTAGCLDRTDQFRAADGSLHASLFTLEEFTGAVVGDERRVESVVPDGEHGHGWNPRTTIVPEIADGDAFVYLGAEGFQHWVDDALPELESEYDDLVLIDALEGIDLLEYDDTDDRGRGHGRDHETRENELDVAQVTVRDRDRDHDRDETIAYTHGGHWHDDPLWVPRDDARSLIVAVADDEGGEIPLGDRYELAVRAADGAPGDLVEVEPDDTRNGHVALSGAEDGFTELVLRVLEDGEVVYEAPPLETEVGEHAHDHGDHGDHGHEDRGRDHHGHEHDYDHSHGAYDAKFFSDPVLAIAGVENIRDELIALDPENETTYEENAEAYIEELEAVHREYERRLSDRDRDVVVLAGHDSFRYLGERYGFEIHTPIGLSPDSAPSSEAIAETVDLVEDRGIEYVLWDYFDGDRLAETIAAEADTVVDTLMVSPAESTTDAWRADGYGDYVGQMTEINLPAFETALGAE